MSNFERIKNCIQAAQVEEVDKKTMLDVFADINDEKLNEIADLFEKKPEWVSIFNDNRKKKITALQTHDNGLWNELIREEKKYLEDLTYGLD